MCTWVADTAESFVISTLLLLRWILSTALVNHSPYQSLSPVTTLTDIIIAPANTIGAKWSLGLNCQRQLLLCSEYFASTLNESTLYWRVKHWVDVTSCLSHRWCKIKIMTTMILIMMVIIMMLTMMMVIMMMGRWRSTSRLWCLVVRAESPAHSHERSCSALHQTFQPPTHLRTYPLNTALKEIQFIWTNYRIQLLNEKSVDTTWPNERVHILLKFQIKKNLFFRCNRKHLLEPVGVSLPICTNANHSHQT